MPKKSDLLNRKFGKLTVVKDAGTRTKHGQVEWLCKCECGNEAVRYSAQLLSMNVQSCGCLRLENANIANTRHGMWKSKEYSSWAHMIGRCENKNNHRFHQYGGRGITVCKEWRESFETFLKDMGPMPSPKHSIDRRDNNLGYNKENCRWATRTEQDNNKSTSRMILYEGRTQTIMQWSKELGIRYEVIRWRLNRGWTPEQILETKVVIGQKFVHKRSKEIAHP